MGHHGCHLLHFVRCSQIHRHNLGFTRPRCSHTILPLLAVVLSICDFFQPLPSSSLMCRLYQCLTNSANLLLFSLFFGHGGFVCAKISFSINLSVIMGFSRINSICAMRMFMSFYINFNPTNSHFARIPKNAFD